ncbi:Rha family transcriptional regulator [Paraburkholderia caballeronis]|uniref:Rha family transcriptional regulator n=1 Tax=Paraburkholderia caballeronis TaxID=416943 RepID=UPI001066B76F|nr:Rha family transcriptional regulator [Paraburkholderia caballeronis]TDV04691.1 Rha family phage regulatory protein [Paraburkholderia caballeronis]TDV07934.1 Rha family phage regulatory protein [Paraburkholderia caballeronis]TDV18225.1 Rha family phage regulatory protein [Paraburkholderia caballeronis]
MDVMDFVMVEGDRPVTDSRKVAQHFVKLHKNVLQAIERLDCSERFAKLNFQLCFENSELQNGKPLKFYRMTKDGFMFLVMGFTGKAAAAMKEVFIEAFNAMADHLRNGLWQCRVDAQTRLDADREQASADGRSLARWRYGRPKHEGLIESLDRQMQLRLDFN